MANMKRLRDGTLQWVGGNWYARLKKGGGSGRKFQAYIVKIGTTHMLHAESGKQFLEHLIRNGDHAAAWEACTPPVRHRLGIRGLVVQEALRAVSGTMRANRSKAEKRLDAIRGIVTSYPPDVAVPMITKLLGEPESDDPDAA